MVIKPQIILTELILNIEYPNNSLLLTMHPNLIFQDTGRRREHIAGRKWRKRPWSWRNYQPWKDKKTQQQFNQSEKLNSANLSFLKRVSLPECFIERPEPAGIAAWAENQQPKERKTKVDRSTPSSPPGYAGHHINT